MTSSKSTRSLIDALDELDAAPGKNEKLLAILTELDDWIRSSGDERNCAIFALGHAVGMCVRTGMTIDDVLRSIGRSAHVLYIQKD